MRRRIHTCQAACASRYAKSVLASSGALLALVGGALAEVGCAKVASANVELVLSGAGSISMKSHCLDPQFLSDYAFLHYNYKYDWLRPKPEEINAAYLRLYGEESRDSDKESSDGSDGK